MTFCQSLVLPACPCVGRCALFMLCVVAFVNNGAVILKLFLSILERGEGEHKLREGKGEGENPKQTGH